MTTETFVSRSDLIMRAVAAEFDITIADLIARRRKHSFPRQIAMCLLYWETRLSMPAVARRVGRSDHSCVLFALRKITRLLATEPLLRLRLDKIMRRVNAQSTAPRNAKSKSGEATWMKLRCASGDFAVSTEAAE